MSFASKRKFIEKEERAQISVFVVSYLRKEIVAACMTYLRRPNLDWLQVDAFQSESHPPTPTMVQTHQSPLPPSHYEKNPPYTAERACLN